MFLIIYYVEDICEMKEIKTIYEEFIVAKENLKVAEENLFEAEEYYKK